MLKKHFFVDVIFNTEINLCLKRQFMQFVKNAIGILCIIIVCVFICICSANNLFPG